ncbi:C-C motif chemokine 20-like [Stegastes partitus]|uniref:C-C motif chemokine n=1 Tax=Stegastes partitus TaxID=144197 RepID=A0A3B4ZG80_9TELE|nr:PREDICTED: C-C motif chemokine 20-like [Stegastes partitus]
MAPTSIITVTTVLLCIMLGILSSAPAALAARRPSCCTKYQKDPLPVQVLRGYREQNDTDFCRIKAIIFFTDSKAKVCANPKAEWVKKALEYLSTRLKNLSKPSPAAGGPPQVPREEPSSPDEKDSFYTATESFLNDTDSFN